MNRADRDVVQVIRIGDQDHIVPILTRGCDGCQYASSQRVTTRHVEHYENHVLSSVEEQARDVAWCSLFNEQAEGGPVPLCREARPKRTRTN